MSETQDYKRFPAVQCWIKHILEGKFSESEKILYTIFGKVKRVRIVATIIEKRELINNQLDDDDDSNIRIEFDLDDGTGIIRAVIWGANPDHYSKYVKGDIVNFVGLIRQWKDFISLSPEIIKKIEDPNYILLKNAEIIKKIKLGEVQEIPEGIIDSDDMSSEIDINELFEEDNSFDPDDPKEIIYLIVEKHSADGNGISFNKLKEKVNLSDDKIRNYIRDLEMESRIYQSEKNIYQTY